MDDAWVDGVRRRGFAAPRVRMPSSGAESWTVVAPDGRPVDVRDLFSRNKKAREIDRALAALVDAGRLKRHHPHDGNGRPAEVWVPLPNAA